VQIDNLNTQSQNDLLKEKLANLIAELKKKEEEVTREEKNIKNEHNNIE
jgi:hypothetical protein